MTSTEQCRKAPDYEAICAVIQLYIDGWKGDPSKFHQAFHEDAWIFFNDADGKPHGRLLSDCFEDWAQTNWEISPELSAVNQKGDIANVTLAFNNVSVPASSYVDLLNLIKVNGIWKITNKTATHASRA